jgi:hypothetical protein
MTWTRNGAGGLQEGNAKSGLADATKQLQMDVAGQSCGRQIGVAGGAALEARHWNRQVAGVRSGSNHQTFEDADSREPQGSTDFVSHIPIQFQSIRLNFLED